MRTRKQKEEQGQVNSPCIKKCSLDENKICPACYRTIDEIVSWPGSDQNTKRKILEAVKNRRQRAESSRERTKGR